MSTFIRRANRQCDFCGASTGESFATDKDEHRDICRQCIVRACELFGVNTSNNKTAQITSMLSSLMKRLLDGDTQTLVKAGYLDKDLSLTDLGEKELLSLFLVANKAELVKSAESKIEEEKADKKC